MFATKYGILWKKLQGSVLPVKHTPGNPFFTEQPVRIVRQRRR
jgi:hypothetical protein